MTTEKEFLEFIAGVLDASVETLSLKTAYESIPQWDSVAHLRLVMEVSDRYGVDIPIERVPELKSLGDFYAFLAK